MIKNSFIRSLYARMRAPQQHDVATSLDVPGSEDAQLPLAYIRPFNALSEYDLWHKSHQDTLTQRVARESSVLPATQQPFHVPGYCVACETQQNFRVDTASHVEQQPLAHSSVNWRESLICPSCGLNNRMRASIDLLGEHMTGVAAANLYITEQLTPLYKWMSNKYTSVIGSEYLGEGKHCGTEYDGIRHEDTTRLSFSNDSLDGVLSFDVLEHIPDYALAIREIFRCLRPGGFLLLSAPFIVGNEHTTMRARQLPDGSVEHLLPAEYHGNPAAPESGSLCYYHFGWDLLDTLRHAGFSNVHIVSYYSFERCNFGRPQLSFWASKIDNSDVLC